MGLKRGFILQALHLIGFIIAFIVARMYYKPLAAALVSWIPYPELPDDQMWAMFLNSMPLENAFYNAIAFALIFFGTKIVLQIIATMLDFVASLPVLRLINKILGAVLGFVEVYLILFIILYIVALVPMGKIQAYLADSYIATLMVEQTPFLSHAVENLWFTEFLGKIF
jgi:uncharacterized membrane protein required for colicin V production